MRNSFQLKEAAVKTFDRDAMFKIVMESIELAEYCEHREALAEARIKKLEEQIKRQVAMIENLEKTLWGKK